MEKTMIVTGFGGLDARTPAVPFTFGAALRLRPRATAPAPNPAPSLDTTPPSTS